MALVRILVDGYSMLHSCSGVAPGRARHSAAAREELVCLLTHYHDAMGTPVSVFFDGAGAPPGTPGNPPSAGVEVLFSKAGQTADEMIERTAHRLRPYGEVLVVTDDYAERDTVEAFGALTSSCENFLGNIEAACAEVRGAVRCFNGREAKGFSRPFQSKGAQR